MVSGARKGQDEGGIAQIANRVTTTADFYRVMRRWAEILNKHLAHIKT